MKAAVEKKKKREREIHAFAGNTVLHRRDLKARENKKRKRNRCGTSLEDGKTNCIVPEPCVAYDEEDFGRT